METKELAHIIRAILQEELLPIKQDLAVLKQDVTVLKQDVTGLKQDVTGLKQDVTDLKQDVATIKGQLDENTRFIGALLHRTEELDAKFDGLMHITVTKEAISHLATKEDIAFINDKIDALNVRLFNQEADIQRLKKAL